MTKGIAAVAAALAVAGLAPTAHAARPTACFGAPSVEASYFCVVRIDGGVSPHQDGGNLDAQLAAAPPLPGNPAFPIFCAWICTDQVGNGGPWAEITQTWVVYYAGSCYYVRPDGSYTTAPATDASGCP